MRIACLSYSAIPSRTANAVHVMKMCQAFAHQGHEVTLYAHFGTEPVEDVYQYYGVPRTFEIVRCWRPPLKDLGGPIYGWAVARAVKARPLPDVCYGLDIYSLVAVAHLGRPLVIEVHVPPRAVVGRKLQAWIFKRSNFSKLVVITHAIRRAYQQIFPWLSEEKILVAPDGADIPQAGTPATLTVPSAERQGRMQVGYVGHLYPGRGIDVILALARRLPEMDFHIVGGMRKDIERWRQAADSLRNVVFHGHVPPAQVEAFRQASQVLLAPYQQAVLCPGGVQTTQWMSPMKVFEYLASRKAIVASDLPVLREVLEQGVNALLVPPQDVEAWADAITTLRDDPALRERLAQRAFKDLATKFTWDRRVKNILEGIAA